MYEETKKHYARLLEMHNKMLDADNKALSKMIALRDKDDASVKSMYDHIIKNIEDRIVRTTARIENDKHMIEVFRG